MFFKSNLFNRRAGYLLIAGAFLLFIVFFLLRASGPRPKVVIVKVVPIETSRRDNSQPVIDFDSESYYRPIIEYNLFRPLGWTPSRLSEPYRLLGTILPRAANTPPKAIIQTTAANTTHIVPIGDRLDADTQIVDIQPKQVTLSTNGQQRTLTLNTAVYLNPSPATRHPRRTIDTPHRQTPTSAPVRSKPTPAPTTVTATQTLDRLQPLSDWQTRDGIPIRLGDARLKNPQKWRLRRR